MQITGWGRYPKIEATITAPATQSAAITALTQPLNSPLIARGLGRSYGDSALAPNILSTLRLNLLSEFNVETGIIRCHAGVSLAELLKVVVPRGWFLPVTPGTKFVTIGGAIAADVHGKNHHGQGCFSEYVLSFNLLLADGQIVECTRLHNSELFHATCGGMGLTGIILQATFQLKAIKSTLINQTTIKAANLAEALTLMEENRQATYSVAWIDCLAIGTALGRSLVMLGEHAENGLLQTPSKRSLFVPIDMPSALLNSWSIKTFNALYYHRVRQQHSQQIIHYEKFFYPLDQIHAWNRLYGKPGFTQYQFVLPKTAGIDAMATILQKIAASGRGSFLAVLKIFGRENSNYLSFPTEGYTLALDFKIDAGLFELLNELDAIVLAHHGRIYLAKDVRMNAETFKNSYQNWEKFQHVREQYGAKGKFVSMQSQRIGLD